MEVKRTERGWAGHFICANDCLFRRNTLLEYGEVKVVVSTVGALINKIIGKNERGITEIGCDRTHETMAFYASEQQGYIDADVTREITFDSKWALNVLTDKSLTDNDINDMHEAVVDEITSKLISGAIA